MYTDTYFQYIDIRVMLSSKAAENFDYVKELMAQNPIEMILYYIDTSVDYESRDKTITHHIRMLNKWLDFNIKKETQMQGQAEGYCLPFPLHNTAFAGGRGILKKTNSKFIDLQ